MMPHWSVILHKGALIGALCLAGTGIGLAKAEVAQRGEDPGASLDFVRPHAAAVVAAVRMAGAQSAVVAPI